LMVPFCLDCPGICALCAFLSYPLSLPRSFFPYLPLRFHCLGLDESRFSSSGQIFFPALTSGAVEGSPSLKHKSSPFFFSRWHRGVTLAPLTLFGSFFPFPEVSEGSPPGTPHVLFPHGISGVFSSSSLVFQISPHKGKTVPIFSPLSVSGPINLSRTSLIYISVLLLLSPRGTHFPPVPWVCLTPRSFPPPPPLPFFEHCFFL